MAIINSPNVTATGVITHDGSGGFTGSTQTEYAVTCGDASNGIQNVASVGTSGQVLTSNGAGALPSFQTLSGAGSLIYVETQTASTSAALQFTDLTQDTYYLVFRNLLPSIANSSYGFVMQVSDDNGSSYASANYQYALRVLRGGSASVNEQTSQGSSFIKLSATGPSFGISDDSSQSGFNGYAFLTNCNNASKSPHIEFNVSYLESARRLINITGGGCSVRFGGNTVNVDAFQIYHTNGNTASGEVLLYYLKES